MRPLNHCSSNYWIFYPNSLKVRPDQSALRSRKRDLAYHECRSAYRPSTWKESFFSNATPLRSSFAGRNFLMSGSTTRKPHRSKSPSGYPGATIAICNKLPLREPELSRLPELKLIAVAATGVDNIDLDYCRSHNIAVCNTRNYAAHSLPEHVLLLMLALRRNLIAYARDVNEGKWQEARQFCLLDHPIHDLHGSTIGIIGYGFLGGAVAALAQAVGMKVLWPNAKASQSFVRNESLLLTCWKEVMLSRFTVR